MPTGTEVQLQPPKNWAEFENICHTLFKHKWSDPDAVKNGRQGQSQNGVDIYGRKNGKGRFHGVQCKGKDGNLHAKLTVAELRKEIENAKTFTPALESLVFATTASNDAAIQEEARKITLEHESNGLFSVIVRGWEDIVSDMFDYPEVIDKHYSSQSRASLRTDKNVSRLLDSQKEGFSTVIGIVDDLRSRMFNTSDAEWDGKFDKNINQQIDSYRKLIEQNKAETALGLLNELKDNEAYATSKQLTKFRIHTNIGAASVALGLYEDAIKHFKLAYDIDNTNAKSQCNHVYAHILENDFNKAKELAIDCLSNFPENLTAASLVIYAHSKDKTIADPFVLIPKAAQDSEEVLHSLCIFYREHDAPEKQLEFASKLYNKAPDNLEAITSKAEAIMYPIFHERGTVQKKIVDQKQRDQLSEAEKLLSRAYDMVLKRDTKYSLPPIAINLATVRRYLGNKAEAETVLLTALSFVTDDAEKDEISFQLVQLYLSTHEGKKGKEMLAGIKRTLNERKFFGAIFELMDGDVKIAIDELLKIVDDDSENKDFRIEALANLIAATEKEAGAKEALKLLNKKMKKFKEEPLLYVVKAQMEGKLEEKKQNRDQSIDKAKECLSANSRVNEILEVADFYLSIAKFEKAAETYKMALTGPSEHVIFEKYLICLINSHNRTALKDVLDTIPSGLLENPTIHKIQAVYYTQIGDLPAAIKSFENYIDRHGANDADVYVRYIQTLLRDNQNDKAKEFCQTPFPSERASLRHRISYYQLLATLGDVRKALEEARKIYISDHEDAHSHLCYLGVFHIANSSGIDLKFLWPTEITLDTEFNVVTDSGERKTFTIEDNSGWGLNDGIIDSTHPISIAAFGKKIGDKIILKKNKISVEEGKIESIRHKYSADHQRIIDTFEHNFPTSDKFMTFKFDANLSPEENFRPVLDILNKRNESYNKLLEEYKTSLVSIGILALALGRNVFEAYQMLRAMPAAEVIACEGSHAEREIASRLDDTNGYVIDALTLYIIHELDIQNLILKATKGNISLTRTALEEIKKFTEEFEHGGERKGYLAKAGDGLAFKEVTDEECQLIRKKYEDIIQWSEKHCKIIPAVADEIHSEILKEILSDSDDGCYDTLLACSGIKGILLSEDLRFRLFGQHLCKVSGVWLQMLFARGCDAGVISKPEYHEVTTKLIEAKHHYVTINVDYLYHLFVAGGFEVSQTLDKAFKYLGDTKTELQSAFGVCSVFLSKIWRDNDIFLRQKEIVTNHVLKSLLYNRWNSLEAVITELQRSYTNFNTPYFDKFQESLEAWMRSHFIPYTRI